MGLFSCKKDETRVVMSTSPVAPTLTTVPNLTLSRANGADMVKFAGTPVDPGFTASATYFLEASLHGAGFADSVVIWSGTQDTAINMATSDLNAQLLKKFPADSTVSADFRIRALLIVDAGTGAPGTSSNPFVYKSAIKTSDIRPYGFPRLDLIGSGIVQKIESPLANGIYSGFVKLDNTMPFTLKDHESGTVYGKASGTALQVDGPALSVTASGWYKLTATPDELTYSLQPFMIGLVGSATPNGWNAPDQKMDYNASTGTWDITITLVDGDFKFRLNDDWGWNLGGTTDNLTHNGANCSITAGNYSISLTITVEGPNGSEAGKYTIKKN